jgi:hypothetical protein
MATHQYKMTWTRLKQTSARLGQSLEIYKIHSRLLEINNYKIWLQLFNFSNSLKSSHYITTHPNLNLEKNFTATSMIIKGT